MRRDHTSMENNSNVVDGWYRNSRLPYSERMNDILQKIGFEFNQASARHRKFNSAHEGYAVLAEEVDELWDEVKKKSSIRSKQRMREEAIQIAAMAARFVYDLCEEG